MPLTPEQLCLERDEVITRHATGRIIARRDARNLITLDPIVINTPDDDAALIVWSGSLADDLNEPHPANWLTPGQQAFAELKDRLIAAATDSAARILIQPHSRHLLSDTQTAYNFINTLDANASEAAPPLGLMLAPATLLEPSMLHPIEDHLTRIFETLAPHAGIVLLTDAVVMDGDDRMQPVPLGAGCLPMDLLRDLAHRWIGPATPVALLDDDNADLASQMALLGL